MISSIIDGVLLSALAATSVCVLLMYRRLQRFDALQGEAARAFAESAKALDNARTALDAFNKSGGEMAVFLADRLNEARVLINDIEHGTDAAFAHAREPAPEPPVQRHYRERAPMSDLERPVESTELVDIRKVEAISRSLAAAAARSSAMDHGVTPRVDWQAVVDASLRAPIRPHHGAN